MQLKTIEPADGRFSFGSYMFECFIGMFPFNMANPDGCGIHKRNACALAQAAELKKYRHREQRFLLQFHKTVVGDRMGKILLAMKSNIIDIEKFNLPAMIQVEQYHNRNYFAVRHCKSPFSALFGSACAYSVAIHHFIHFFTKFVD
jgi:hypothetical protein